jgi:hypothetical protein
MSNPFRYFKTSPEVIRLAVMMYVRFPLSLRNVEDLLHERGIDVSHETVRVWQSAITGWRGLGVRPFPTARFSVHRDLEDVKLAASLSGGRMLAQQTGQ